MTSDTGSPGKPETTLANAPPLPPRDHVPLLPPRGPPTPPLEESKPQMKPIYNETSGTATILVIRQNEIYGSPGMNMHADTFSSSPINLTSKVEDDGTIWPEIVADYSDEYVRKGKIPQVEEAILAGIPSAIRPYVYLKTLQVKAHMDATSYSSLVKKAKSSASGHIALVQSLDFPEEQKELIQVFDFCIREIDSVTEDQLVSSFITLICPLVLALGLSKPEALALLFKFNALSTRLFKDEFFYKASRLLEDAVPEVFLHISKQGIDLTGYFRSVLSSLLAQDPENKAQVLDFVVFEGFDYYHRLLSAIFKSNLPALLGLNGDDLNDYIYLGKLLKVSPEILALSIQMEPSVIRYENEFHLMNANQMSGNHHELSNLKEANDDLVLKISELTQRTENLRKTQSEMLAQGEEFGEKLQHAEAEKAELEKQASDLQERYAHLTMKENLSNTIKANEDISRGNTELEAQIAALQKKVDTKRAKLAKVSS